MQQKHVVILGAGPAGLTAARELCATPGWHVTLVELESQVGGISRTIVYQGNRMDIGGHRFFSKSDVVMRWWQAILPLQGAPACDETGPQQRAHLARWPGTADPEREENVLLIRSRLSRIYYLGKFFDYPVSLCRATLQNLGVTRVCKMGLGYLHACLFPIRPEKNLEDFFINRFGRELYKTFFRDYTKKVWGVACHNIAPDWGAQRVRGLSIVRVLSHALRRLVSRKDVSLAQEKTETSLIGQFFYPKFGPGQLWERVAELVTASGATLLLEHEAFGLACEDGRVTGVRIRNRQTGEEQTLDCDAVIASLPLRELAAMLPGVPEAVRQVAEGLVYRDFITVGLLVDKLQVNEQAGGHGPLRDNWLYIQEPGVALGRVQFFHNWSPYLVADSGNMWLGLEYFANEGDALWTMTDDAFLAMAIRELDAIGIIAAENVLDGTVLRIKKAYPAYFGSYKEIDVLQRYLDGIPNLYPVGRNGMHRYNNMDHSMLSAMYAVSCLNDPARDKSGIWSVNADDTYHETK